jgi:hypothetical protein
MIPCMGAAGVVVTLWRTSWHLRQPHTGDTTKEKETHMENYTIKNGTAALTQQLTPGLTVGDVLANPNFASVLGYDASNVEIFSAGVKLDPSSRVVADDTLIISPKAHGKASL